MMSWSNYILRAKKKKKKESKCVTYFWAIAYVLKRINPSNWPESWQISRHTSNLYAEQESHRNDKKIGAFIHVHTSFCVGAWNIASTACNVVQTSAHSCVIYQAKVRILRTPRIRVTVFHFALIAGRRSVRREKARKWKWKFIRTRICLSGIVVSNAGTGGVPVGIAVARQRLQHQETSTSMRNVSLSHHTSHHASYHHFQPDNLGKFLRSLYVPTSMLLRQVSGKRAVNLRPACASIYEGFEI